MKSKKLLLSLGLLLVFFNGLMRLPEVQSYFFSGDLFETRLLFAIEECNNIEIILVNLRADLDNLEWLADQNFHNTVIYRLLYDPPSKFSQICGKFFPRYFWKIELFFAKQRYVSLKRKLKYLHTMLDYLSLTLDKDLAQSNNNSLIKQSDQRIYILDQIKLIKAELMVYGNETKFFSHKLKLLEKIATRP